MSLTFVAAVMPGLTAALSALLQKKAVSQQEETGEEPDQERAPDDEDEDEERDIELIEATCDLITQAAKVLGPAFDPYFEVLLPHILAYCVSTWFACV